MQQYDMNSRKCPHCGAPIGAGERFCTYCGKPVEAQSQQPQYQAPQYQQPQYQQPQYQQGVQYQQYGAPAVDPRSMTKQEYRRACTDSAYLKRIKTAAILAYVSVGLTVLSMLLTQSFWALLDIAIVLPLAICLQIRKSKGCAIGLLVYGIVALLVNIVVNQSVGGWLWLVTAISAVTAFSIPDKQYEAARSSMYR